MIRLVALCVLLTGCHTPPPPAAKVAAPSTLTACPPNVPTPRALPRVRTAAQIAQGYNAVDIAREKNAAARDACAWALRRLNDWYLSHQN